MIGIKGWSHQTLGMQAERVTFASVVMILSSFFLIPAGLDADETAGEKLRVEVIAENSKVPVTNATEKDYYGFVQGRIHAAKLIGAFTVLTRIRNESPEPREFILWSCSYGYHWISDNDWVIYSGGEVCLNNIAIPEVIPAFGTYERKLKLGITENARPGVLEFRLGFRPIIHSNLGGERTIRYSDIVGWSNPVKIQVVEES